MSFENYSIDPKCLAVLRTQQISEPTPIQAAALPPALDGRDLLAVAQTGTGKSLAFTLPAMTRLAKGKFGRDRMLVLAPTRELALQVHKTIEPFCKTLGMRSTCIYGGASMEPQVRALRHGVDIVVATPGRLLDHMARGTVKFNQLSILVLDEADRMLDMGFLPDIRRILDTMPKERQTMLFSATFPEEIAQLTKEFQRNAERIEIAPSTTNTELVTQRLYTVDSGAKSDLLADVLSQPGVNSAIVFIRTKHRTDRIAKQLAQRGIRAQAIHGGRSQGQRQRALEDFRRGAFDVLVATDVAARGIDVQGITHVVNFDIPRTFDDYVHRIGRTGRAKATGDAVTFVSPEEAKELALIEKGLGVPLERVDWAGAVPVRSVFDQKHAGRGHAPRREQGNGRGQSQGRGHGNAAADGNAQGKRPFRKRIARNGRSHQGQRHSHQGQQQG